VTGKIVKKIVIGIPLKCERLSTGKTRAENSCRVSMEPFGRTYWRNAIIIDKCRLCLLIISKEKNCCSENTSSYECRLFNGCKVIAVQLIFNVVPKVSPKHNIVILSCISYKLCELLKIW